MKFLSFMAFEFVIKILISDVVWGYRASLEYWVKKVTFDYLSFLIVLF